MGWLESSKISCKPSLVSAAQVLGSRPRPYRHRACVGRPSPADRALHKGMSSYRACCRDYACCALQYSHLTTSLTKSHSCGHASNAATNDDHSGRHSPRTWCCHTDCQVAAIYPLTSLEGEARPVELVSGKRGFDEYFAVLFSLYNISLYIPLRQRCSRRSCFVTYGIRIQRQMSHTS